MSRVYNFSPGPAALPEEVLRQAADEMLDWHGCGMSIMEVSHRGRDFTEVAREAQADLRELLDIPEHYKVLFLQGGAIGQNAAVPLNLLRGRTRAAYVDTGAWSTKSISEARRYCEVKVVASSAAEGYARVPKQDEWQPAEGSAYVHVCTNETIGGLEYHWTPDSPHDTPLVADMSSHILSRPIDVAQYGLIYAGAQKNIGQAGVTIVIVREDLIGQAHSHCPSVLNYQVQAENDSMFNTPPTYAIYIAGLVFQWLKRQGGLAGMEKRNIEKAELLYETLDQSDFYRTRVCREDRSRMNVTFFLGGDDLTQAFLAGASERGMLNLKGHKLVGGVRASIYNSMSLDGVRTLVEWMKEFERDHG